MAVGFSQVYLKRVPSLSNYVTILITLSASAAPFLYTTLYVYIHLYLSPSLSFYP